MYNGKNEKHNMYLLYVEGILNEICELRCTDTSEGHNRNVVWCRSDDVNVFC